MLSPENDVDAPSGYNNAHRAFLQALLARQTLNFEQAKPILAKLLSQHGGREVVEDDITIEDFTSFIHEINNQLEQFGYEVVSTYPQTAKNRSEQHRLYVLVNTHSDQFTQLSTTHSADEIAYIKRVLDAMFETFNTPSREVMAMTSFDALKLAKAPRDRESIASASGEQTQGSGGSSLTQKQAEEVLGSLVQEGWFERSKAGYYTLSPRGLTELRHWLKDAYNDGDAEPDDWQPIKDCNACKEIVTIGQRCSNDECNCRLHNFCAKSMFQGQQTKICPACNTPWTGSGMVGERAAKGYREPGRVANG